MLSVENLTFAFKRNQPLFSGLDLELKAGKTYGLFGLNGAGKTSLLNHILGMLFPETGRCTLYGKPTSERRPEILSELFVVPEQFELPSLSAQKYVDIHAPFYPRFDRVMMDSILEEFEINPYKKIPALSYGQRKKFLIAFALATQSSLLLMDEPTNGLDIPSKSQFRKIVASMDNSSRCILISTHQVRDLGAMIDHITVLKNGKIVFNHTLDQITRTLSFQKLKDNKEKDYIYSEEMLGGIHAICPSAGSNDTEIDLELLFNGIIQETERINQEFQNSQS